MLSKQDQIHVLNNVGDSWTKLKDKSVFITGGTGFIGKWLIGSLLIANRMHALNCRVTVLTRNALAFRESFEHIADDPTVSIIENDVRACSKIDGEYNYIIHAATDVARINPPIDTFDVCLFGTKSALDLAIKSKDCNFLFLSSGAVYGKQPYDLTAIPETYNGIPERTGGKSAYGIGKIAAEWMVSQYGQHYGLSTKIARCFAFVGPYLPMDGQFAIGNFIKNAMTSDSITINGDGSPVRTYLYGADLALWLWRILLDGVSGDVFNVGGDRPISIEGLAILTRNLLNPNAKIIIKGTKADFAAPERYVPDITLASAKLGLGVAVSLEDSIERTARWYFEVGK